MGFLTRLCSDPAKSRMSFCRNVGILVSGGVVRRPQLVGQLQSQERVTLGGNITGSSQKAIRCEDEKGGCIRPIPSFEFFVFLYLVRSARRM